MQRSLLLKAMGCMAAGICLLDVQAQAQQRIVNGGFESGLTGWTQLDQVGSDGSFFAQSGTASPINAFPVPAPPQGTKAAMTDAQAGGSHVLYQDFTVPFAVTSGTVSFSLYLNSGNAFITPSTLDWAGTDRNGGLNLNQQARVDIITTAADPFSVAGGDVLQNLFQTNPAASPVSGYTLSSVNILGVLQAHQGQTLRLRFAEVDNVNFFNLGVDGVSLQTVPEPSSIVMAGAGLLGFAMLRRRRTA